MDPIQFAGSRVVYKQLDITEFLKLPEGAVVIDARSEAEFARGHIPGAVNIPILNNEERVEIGTCYKKKGKQEAVLLGFDLVGKRFGDIARNAVNTLATKQVHIYCWRGGMRSNILSWILSVSGFKVSLLKGGYKKFRNFTLECLAQSPRLLVLGGATGCGKTHLLLRLKELGQEVLDLEGFAHHRGSAYGALGMPEQPTQEQFENNLGTYLSTLPQKYVWVENESRMIGKVKVPDAIYNALRSAPLVELVLDTEHRIQNILKDYAVFEKEALIASTAKLQKRLGGLRTKEAIEAIEENRLTDWIKNVLQYYDKTYAYGLEERNGTTAERIELDYFDIDVISRRLMEIKNRMDGI